MQRRNLEIDSRNLQRLKKVSRNFISRSYQPYRWHSLTGAPTCSWGWGETDQEKNITVPPKSQNLGGTVKFLRNTQTVENTVAFYYIIYIHDILEAQGISATPSDRLPQSPPQPLLGLWYFIIIFNIYWGGYKRLRTPHIHYWGGPSPSVPP